MNSQSMLKEHSLGSEGLNCALVPQEKKKKEQFCMMKAGCLKSSTMVEMG